MVQVSINVEHHFPLQVKLVLCLLIPHTNLLGRQKPLYYPGKRHNQYLSLERYANLYLDKMIMLRALCQLGFPILYSYLNLRRNRCMPQELRGSYSQVHTFPVVNIESPGRIGTYEPNN